MIPLPRLWVVHQMPGQRTLDQHPASTFGALVTDSAFARAL
jgi:hypothetical protein